MAVRDNSTTSSAVRHWIGLAILTGLVFLIWWGVLGGALTDDPIDTAVRGGVADWLVVREAWTGGDAYAPVSLLADKWLGLTNTTPAAPHPRPPSAIAALISIGAVPPGAVIVALALVMATCLVLATDLLIRWLSFPHLATWVVALVMASTTAMIQGAVWGTHIPLVAVFLLVFAVAPTPDPPRYRSALGGVAIGLKLFPALVVLTRAKANRRHALTAFVVFMLLTLAGLLLPGVGASEAWAAVAGASTEYGGTFVDMSLAAHLGVQGEVIGYLIPLTAIALVPLLWKIDDEHLQVAIALILMLLAAPMAWPEYQLLALPAALVLWQRSVVGKAAAAVWLGVLTLTLDGRIHLAALLVLGAALLYETLKVRTQSSRASSLTS